MGGNRVFEGMKGGKVTCSEQAVEIPEVDDKECCEHCTASFSASCTCELESEIDWEVIQNLVKLY